MTNLQRTVYVVDDDESVRKALGRLLKSAGYDAETFASAEDFLQKANCHLVKCLVLDVRLNGMSGFELREHLCACNFNIPIVYITAHEDPEARGRSLRSDAAWFLRKPFDEKVLLHAVDSIFQQWENPGGDL